MHVFIYLFVLGALDVPCVRNYTHHWPPVHRLKTQGGLKGGRMTYLLTWCCACMCVAALTYCLGSFSKGFFPLA